MSNGATLAPVGSNDLGRWAAATTIAGTLSCPHGIYQCLAFIQALKLGRPQRDDPGGSRASCISDAYACQGGNGGFLESIDTAALAVA